MAKATVEQQRVIDVLSGFWMVQACPGSGKTQTLVWRCKALGRLTRKLMLAFNKLAAEQITVRVGDSTVMSKTFHSFCLQQIMRDFPILGYTKRPQFPDKAGYYGMLKQMNAACGTEYYTWEQSPWDDDLIQGAGRTYTSDLEDRQSTLLERGEDVTVAERMELNTLSALLKYRKWLIAENIITFDAMVQLVAENLDIIELDVEHIMVDEYQDVDQMQYDIVVHMAQMHGVESVIVVGDRNQSIYGWRGALGNPFEMFEHDLPNVEELVLTKNFRSVDPILEHAERIAPVGMTGVRGKGSDAFTTLGTGQSRTWILDGYQGGNDVSLAQRIILCRYNLDCYRWQLALARDGIPVNVFGKGDFWSMGHVKLAKRGRKQGMTADAVLNSSQWKRFTQTRRFAQDEDFQKEAVTDVKWVMSLTSKDMEVLETCMTDERRGLKISTIHKTKGKEFKRVLVHGVDKRLMSEMEVYYVACTRAEDNLALHIVKSKSEEE